MCLYHTHVRFVLVVLVALAGTARADDKSLYVIDRAQVPRFTFKPLQGGEASAALLVHDPAIALVQVDLPTNLHLDLTRTDRREVWYVISGYGFATGYYDRFKQTISPDWKDATPGLVVDVPAGSSRRLDAGNEPLSALAIYLPGDIAGIVDQSLLPGTAVTEPIPHEKPSLVRYTKRLKTYKTKGIELRLVELAPKRKLAAVKKTLELLYVLAGTGTAQIGGKALALDGKSVVHIPAGTARTITATTKLRAIQILVPQP